jgi:DNA-binding NarL/FixJ family response regulator
MLTSLKPLSDLRLAVQRVLAGERWVSSSLVDKLVSYADTPTHLSPLTTRQQDVLRLLQQGLDNQTIARRLGLSVKTIENHLTRIYRQLDVRSRLEAVNYTLQHPELLARSTVVAAPSPETVVHERVTMLLVDDNVRYRRQLRRMISQICPRSKIYEAENMGEALHLTRRVAPQLVLVDVVLGEEDGICCARRVKAQSSQSRVILISAYPDRGFRRLGLEAGVVAFLDKKDLDAATLRQIIDDVID